LGGDKSTSVPHLNIWRGRSPAAPKSPPLLGNICWRLQRRSRRCHIRQQTVKSEYRNGSERCGYFPG